LVGSSSSGLGHPDARQHRQPLPAAAQAREWALAQRLGNLERVEHHIDAPAFAVGLLRRQGLADEVMENRVREPGRDILLDMPDAQAARARDLACAGLEPACETMQEGGLAPAIGGDEAEAVIRPDRQVQIRKKRRAKVTPRFLRLINAIVGLCSARAMAGMRSWSAMRGRGPQPPKLGMV
jgi:hypothetical protein